MINYSSGLKWLWLTVLVFCLDLWTKNLASQFLQMHEPVTVIPGFNLTLMHNYGAAFSFLGDAGGWQRWFFICLTVVVSTFILIWLYGLKAKQRWIACALAMILGGAIGNLWDRVTLGYVIDYIGFLFWPSFNIADVAITVGGLMLIYYLIKEDSKSSKK